VTKGYTNASDSFAQTLMMDDIAALQAMYGANYAHNGGDTVYSWSPLTGEMSVAGIGQGAPAGNRIFMTVWDGGGEDTYDLSLYNTDVVIDLNPGSWSITSRSQLANLSGSKLAIGNIANAKLYERNTQSLIENATSGSGNDKIIGNSGNNRIDGGAGDDILSGGSGNDVFIGGSGADNISGGPGWDTIDFSNASSAISLDVRNGGTIGDAMGDRATAIEALICSAFDDYLNGGGAAEQIFGGAGNDTLCGGGANDAIDGGLGADLLRGDAGYDRLTGGGGADVFVFTKSIDVGSSRGRCDVISDFATGQDLIDLSAMDANTTLIGVQDFNFLTTPAARFGAAGDLRVRYETGATGEWTIIEGNLNKTAAAEFRIEIVGTHLLSSADFIL
jgi:serralysin